MNPQQPVSFPDWKAALASSDLSSVVQTSHTREILTFLHHCKKHHSPVTVEFIKQWLAGPRLRVTMKGMIAGATQAREALLWFYQRAPKATDNTENGTARNPRPPNTVAGASKTPTEKLPEGESSAKSGHPVAPMRSKAGSYNQRQPLRPMEPRPTSQDLGGPDWEPRIASHAAFSIGVS